ncbi:hypothetical protein WN51_06960 [Melipona quadrifasciata]|uniref:Uncharacterized protein n=1 Tax=Melipona quadrifasciata TaxID=166423 RepID=A0A0M8ZSI4_9HYME|nr:hypothetical protein WN51_06960 [Melipona quadrifasciata]
MEIMPRELTFAGNNSEKPLRVRKRTVKSAESRQIIRHGEISLRIKRWTERSVQYGSRVIIAKTIRRIGGKVLNSELNFYVTDGFHVDKISVVQANIVSDEDYPSALNLLRNVFFKIENCTKTLHLNAQRGVAKQNIEMSTEECEDTKHMQRRVGCNNTTMHSDTNRSSVTTGRSKNSMEYGISYNKPNHANWELNVSNVDKDRQIPLFDASKVLFQRLERVQERRKGTNFTFIGARKSIPRLATNYALKTQLLQIQVNPVYNNVANNAYVRDTKVLKDRSEQSSNIMEMVLTWKDLKDSISSFIKMKGAKWTKPKTQKRKICRNLRLTKL